LPIQTDTARRLVDVAAGHSPPRQIGSEWRQHHPACKSIVAGKGPLHSIGQSPHATDFQIAESSIRKLLFPFRRDCGLCCLARERAEQTRAARKRCPPCGDASVIVGVTLASELQVTRSGSPEMHAVIGSARNGSRSSYVGVSTARVCTSSRYDSASKLRVARPKGPLFNQFLCRTVSDSEFKFRLSSLDACSVESTDDTDPSVGSASFSGNPAWGRHCELTDVLCMLTRRTRLQYMCCNGVGGSTC
jgi:hypothetical protein